RARGGAGRAARPVGGVDGAQHDAPDGPAAHHPAAGIPGDDPAVGQPVHRALEGDGHRVVHHDHRSHLSGQGHQRRHAADSRCLQRRARHLSLHSPGHHVWHALTGTLGGDRPGAWPECMTMFDWSFTLEILPVLARAAIVTIEATLAGFALAAPLGLVLAILRMVPGPYVAPAVIAVIEFIRSTPLVIQIFYLYFVILPVLHMTPSAFTAGVFALGIHYATYCSEVYRAGLENIPRGQWEASIALNLSTYRTFRDVI